MLTIAELHKSFGPHHVLKGIDLAVAPGEVVCLIGASGSGKSTLLKCINLLEPVDDGVIYLDDRDITDPKVDSDAVRREIGIVFQAYNLFPHLSVLRNITLAPTLVGGQSRKAATASAHELLVRVGLEEKAKAYPDALSGGQQQRVAIARALALKPRLLLLDEVTSALDPMLVGEVLDVVREVKSDGVAVMMATHEMAFAREVADRVAFMADGQIVEIGTPEQVLESPADPRTQKFLSRWLR